MHTLGFVSNQEVKKWVRETRQVDQYSRFLSGIIVSVIKTTIARLSEETWDVVLEL